MASHAEMGVTEAILLVLGAFSKRVVLSLVIYTEITNGANHTSSPLATTTPLENMDLVEQANLPPNAKSHASTEKITLVIKYSLLMSTQSQVKLK